ncbi:MAG: DUF6350 family protein [Propionibacteriaceae bacterium]|jgi:hypothetical protein|nr:DUF6350 family protein [Propionibacteriaceae bacterium]
MALGAIGTALAGWVSLLAATMLGWLSVPALDVSRPVQLAAQLWLLGHGAHVDIAGQAISIAPLGFSLLWFLAGSALAEAATHHSLAAVPGEERRGIETARLAAVYAVTYLVLVLGIGVLLQGAVPWRGLIGAGLLGLFCGVRGVGRACRWRPTLLPWWLKLPAWLRALPQTLTVGALTALAGGALVLVVALRASRERFMELHNALAPDVIGGVLLLIIQLAWWPNLVLWATSWVMGAGFGLGTGAFVTPLANQSGMLPGLPVFAVVPETGAASPWQALWLLVPVAAGVLAGLTMLRTVRADVPVGRPLGTGLVRPDTAAIIGGFAGALAGLSVVALAALSGGDLGTVRLIGLGPLLLGLLILAPTTMGVAGLLAAALAGLRVYRRQRPSVEKMSLKPVPSVTLVGVEMFSTADS